MSLPILNEEMIAENLKKQKNRFFDEYYVLYSSWHGGLIKDPHLMLLPIDDHMVHRGDGVFEAIKIVDKGIYLLDEHLTRLFSSAEKISLKPQVNLGQLKEIVIETARAANKSEAMIRIFLSRGPGNFSVNPYDSIESQIYIMIHKPHPPTAEKYEKGVAIGKSQLGIKPTWISQVKSCNYLPNVLMKKEAIDRGLDFVFNTDEDENITECSTENIVLFDQEGVLTHPKLDYILKGTTMTRVFELAEKNKTVTQQRSISIKDLEKAQEVMIVGTTLNVLSAVRYENHLIGGGKPGPLSKELANLIIDDIHSGQKSTRF